MAVDLRTTNGVSYLRSALLAGIPGVEHAFSTRVGGVSGVPHDTLNLGFHGQDPDENVSRNWERFLEAIGADWRGVWFSNQVHGARVREAPEGDGYSVLGEGDALWTREARVGLSILTADCVPVLVASRDGSVVGAAHAGWRGMVGGVVEATLAELTRARGVPNRELAVAAGPHIGACCFEVQADVAAPFAARFGSSVVELQGGRTTIALGRALRILLEGAGVPAESIEIAGACTSCSPELFFSYRRAKGRERGRLASVIARRPERA